MHREIYIYVYIQRILQSFTCFDILNTFQHSNTTMYNIKYLFFNHVELPRLLSLYNIPKKCNNMIIHDYHDDMILFYRFIQLYIYRHQIIRS